MLEPKPVKIVTHPLITSWPNLHLQGQNLQSQLKFLQNIDFTQTINAQTRCIQNRKNNAYEQDETFPIIKKVNYNLPISSTDDNLNTTTSQSQQMKQCENKDSGNLKMLENFNDEDYLNWQKEYVKYCKKARAEADKEFADKFFESQYFTKTTYKYDDNNNNEDVSLVSDEDQQETESTSETKYQNQANFQKQIKNIQSCQQVNEPMSTKKIQKNEDSKIGSMKNQQYQQIEKSVDFQQIMDSNKENRQILCNQSYYKLHLQQKMLSYQEIYQKSCNDCIQFT